MNLFCRRWGCCKQQGVALPRLLEAIPSFIPGGARRMERVRLAENTLAGTRPFAAVLVDYAHIAQMAWRTALAAWQTLLQRATDLCVRACGG